MAVMRKPHIHKVAKFVLTFPWSLRCTEHTVNFAVRYGSPLRVRLYNPDFYCEHTNMFIEVVTSLGNLSTQRAKYRAMWKQNSFVNFGVYAWTGENISDEVYAGSMPECLKRRP